MRWAEILHPFQWRRHRYATRPRPWPWHPPTTPQVFLVVWPQEAHTQVMTDTAFPKFRNRTFHNEVVELTGWSPAGAVVRNPAHPEQGIRPITLAAFAADWEPLPGGRLQCAYRDADGWRCDAVATTGATCDYHTTTTADCPCCDGAYNGMDH